MGSSRVTTTDFNVDSGFISDGGDSNRVWSFCYAAARPGKLIIVLRPPIAGEQQALLEFASCEAYVSCS